MEIRKIQSKEEEARKKRRNQWVLGAIMVFILTGGVFGIMVSTFGNSDNGNTGLNGQKRVSFDERDFFENRGFWLTQNPLNKEGYLGFIYLPNQTIDLKDNEINLNEENLNYAGMPLYIDSEQTEVFSSVYRNFQELALRIQNACINKSDCKGNSPIKTCQENMIVIRESNETSITQKNKCVYIKAPKEDIVKATEEFVYRYYGIK